MPTSLIVVCCKQYYSAYNRGVSELIYFCGGCDGSFVTMGGGDWSKKRQNSAPLGMRPKKQDRPGSLH